MSYGSLTRWKCPLKEHLKRVAVAFLAAAMLLSACPVAGYAAALAMPQDLTPAAKAENKDTKTGDSAAKGAGRPAHAVPHRHSATRGQRLPQAPSAAAQPAQPPAPVVTPAQAAAQLPDSILLGAPLTKPAEVVESEIRSVDGRLVATPVDTVAIDERRPEVDAMKAVADEVNARVDSLKAGDGFLVAPDMLTAGEAYALDSIANSSADSIAAAAKKQPDEWVPREVEFVPNPTKAVWLSALFPGLGQIYNRRYWKLPIIVGGYLGLAYATNWNNNMLRDYTVAYAALLDTDPNTRSYMNMFAPNVKEENLDRGWLKEVMRSRKNYFRRNRDLCIIAMVGVYLLEMFDAYGDASLSHFDISPDLSMDVAPAMIQDGRPRYPSVGLVWAVNF